MWIPRLIAACLLALSLQDSALATVSFQGEQLPVALEDGRLRWKEGRYVDPEGSIMDYWVAPQAIYMAVATADHHTLLKRLDPIHQTLDVLLDIPSPGVVRFHPLAAYAIVPTASAWQLLELPYLDPTPRLLLSDPIAPHVSAYVTHLVIKRGSQLWHLAPLGAMTLIDSDVVEWQPGRDLFEQPDVWTHESWMFRTIPPLLPSGLYRRASGRAYLLNPQLQPTPLMVPEQATMLPIHPASVVDTEFLPIVKIEQNRRLVDLWSFRTHRVVHLQNTAVSDNIPDPLPDTLMWGRTAHGAFAVVIEGTLLKAISLENGAIQTIMTAPAPIRRFDIHMSTQGFWVRPDHGFWYEVGTANQLPAETIWNPIPTSLPTPQGISSLLIAQPTPESVPITELAPVAVAHSAAASEIAQSSLPSAIAPDSTPVTAFRPSTTAPLTGLPTVRTPPATLMPPMPEPAMPPPSKKSVPQYELSAETLAHTKQCFTLASAGTLRAFPDPSAPKLESVPARTIYQQTMVTERVGRLWYRLILTSPTEDPLIGWVSGSEITPLGPCAAEPSSRSAVVQ